jgi:hypothetical protein
MAQEVMGITTVRERLTPGSRAQLSSDRALEADLNFPSLDLGLMIEGRVAHNSKPWRDRGHVALARLECEAVSVAVLADIGITGLSRGEV